MTKSKSKISTPFSEAPTRGGRQLLASFGDHQELVRFSTESLLPDDSINEQSNLIYRNFLEPVLIELPPDESKHALKALRLKEGETLRVIDSQLKLIAQGKLIVKSNVAFVETYVVAKLIKNYPDIVIGIPENKTAEACIEKLTEMGINSINFFKGDYSQKSSSDFEKTEARLLKKRDVAVKQSYSLNVPNINIKPNLVQAIQDLNCSNNQLVTLFSPKDAEVIDQHQIKLENLADIFTMGEKLQVLVVGPEGGFSLTELTHLLELKSRFLSLGPNTLRVETAASLAIAAVNSIPF